MTETALPASATLDSVVSTLHDHAAFQSQQSMAAHHEVTPTPPAASFVVTKALSFRSAGTAEPEYRSVTVAVPMGPWTSEVISQTAFVDTEDGMYVIFQAPLGLTGWSRWRVAKGEVEGKGVLLLREEATLTGYRFLMPFIVRLQKKEHKEFQVKFARSMEGALSNESSGRLTEAQEQKKLP